MRNSGEPSVEEILESIKKVIARDGQSDARSGGEIERTRRPAERPAVTPTTGEPASEDHDDEVPDDDVLDLAAMEALVDDDVNDEARFEDDNAAEESPLLNADAQQSMRESLAALAMLAQPGAQPQIVRSGETSLEGLVREMLKPMLADWLDRNLPPMVEQLVKAEIARIVGKKA